MLIVVVLFATVVLRLAIVGAVVYVILPKGFSCPRCADRLNLIHHPVMKLLLPHVEHRWCLGCGWNGLVTRGKPPRPVPQSRVVSRAARS